MKIDRPTAGTNRGTAEANHRTAGKKKPVETNRSKSKSKRPARADSTRTTDTTDDASTDGSTAAAESSSGSAQPSTPSRRRPAVAPAAPTTGVATPTPPTHPAAASSAPVTTATTGAPDAAAGDAKPEPKPTGFQAVIDDVLKTIGLHHGSAHLGSSPIGPVDAAAPALWPAARQHRNVHLSKLPAATTTTSDVPPATPDAAAPDADGPTAASPGPTWSESERGAVHAAIDKSLGWVSALDTAIKDLVSGQDLREFTNTVQHWDLAGTGDEVGDMVLDAIGRVPVIGVPLAQELRALMAPISVHTISAATVSTAAPLAAAVSTDTVSADAATADAAAADPAAAAFLAVIQRAVDRLAGTNTWIWHQLGWPGAPHQFVDMANNQIDRVLDAADDQLDALIANPPAGSPAAVISGFVDILHYWMAPAVPNYSFSDTLNALGDFLNRVVPPFEIVDGAGTLNVISVYKIMGAAVAGTATALGDMLNGVYDLQQIEIDVIYTTTGATVTKSDLTNFTTLGAKVAASILVGGGAYSNPSKVLSQTTLPTWTAEQVNPFTVVTYTVLVGLYKRFQEIANYAKFTTNTTYESWIYTVDLGSASTRSQYAAGSFHAFDQDGRPVSFQPADGNTYTSAWGALVTINTYDGGYTYTATLPGEDYFHAGAAGQYDTVTIPVYTEDGAPYDVTFQIKIVSTVNSTPKVTTSVGSADTLGVVRGTAAGNDSDGDTLTYSLVGSSVTGLSGNSAYTTNGGIVTLNSSTGAFTYASTSTGGSSASFQVQVDDGHGGIATTTVTVPNTTSITPGNVNTATQGVVSGSLTVPPADAGMFSYALGTRPSYGSVSFDPATGAFTYTRTASDHSTPSADSFTVVATDANGRTVTLRVPVQPTVADAPPTLTLTTAPTVGTLSGSTDTTGSATSTQTSTGKFDTTDADGDTVTFSATTGSQGGTLTFNADGSFTYTGTLSNKIRHAAARIGATSAQMNDTFTVTASDGYGGTATYTLNVPIYAINSAPTISSWSVTHALVTIGTLVKVSDADGDLSSSSKPRNGNGNDGNPWYTFSRSTNTFNWYGSGGVQDFSASGTGNITFTVGDGYYVVVNGVVTNTASSASKTG